MADNISMMKNDILTSIVDSYSDDSASCNLIFDYEDLLNNFGVPGDYLVKVSAVDTSGNRTDKEAYVHIIDDLAPEFYIKSFLLETTTDSPYSKEDLIKEIKRNLDERRILYSDVEIIGTEYDSMSNKEGIYNIRYKYEYNDISNYEVATIKVLMSKNNSQNNNSLYLLCLIPLGVLGIGLYINKKKKLRK